MRVPVAVPIGLVLALNAAVVAGTIRLREAGAQLERGYAARAAVHAIAADLSQAEAGLGVYAATGDPAFLEAFERVREELPARVEHLREALTDPAGAEHLQKELLAASAAHLDALTRLRDTLQAGHDVPRELVAAARAARSGVRTATARMTFREDERLLDGRSSARLLEAWVIGAAAAAALAGLACAAVAGLVLNGGGRAAAGAPARRAARLAADPAPAPQPAPPASVLIVDDDRHIRDVLQRWLKPAGFDVRQAPDAQAALAAVAEEVPAVVLCDIHMPGRDGLWLAERVRGLAPSCAIVLATGDDAVPPFESLKTGVVAYVLKPFRRDELIAAVRDGVRWSAEARKVVPHGRAALSGPSSGPL